MGDVALEGGFYKAKSLIAGAQACTNLYPEKNQKGAPFPWTYYQRPGNELALTGPGAAARCQYRATNGQMFEVLGTAVYYTDSTPARHLLGTIAAGSTQCSMADNGTVLVLVDGTSAGYVINLGTHVMTTISDPAFYGSTRVEYMDTYFIFNRPGTTQWYLSPQNWNGTDPFDALDIANKVGGADLLQCAAANAGNILLIGTLTTEVWYNAAGADFVFARVPSVFIEHGTPAPYSVVQNDVGTYLLSQDDDGGSIIAKIVGYNFQRISTHAIENVLGSYSTLADCVARTYQMEGHAFASFTFPTGDGTWVWDEGSQLWHEETWCDDDGIEHRHRAQCGTYAYGINWMSDWENGNLYIADFGTFEDQGAVNHPIVFRKGFQHLVKGGKRVSYTKLIAAMQAAAVSGGLTDDEQFVSLRFSDTKGYSWSDPVTDGVGSTGDHGKQITFWQLGLAADRVFELFWSAPYQTALMGAFIDAEPAET
jgi:hypothetical protein